MRNGSRAELQGTGLKTGGLPGTQQNREVNPYPITDSWTIVLVATNAPQQAAPIRVPYGATVRLRASNNGSGNSKVIFVSTDPRVFAGGGGTPLQPLDDVEYPVGSLGQIWAYGTVGDGVVVSVTKSAAS